ncbi:MAG: beta-propeller fold lactonase family protein [Methylophilaceae bacterium]|jgi:YVTN family beta-propeller protein|nr:MAG: beta-propeller fold lactonase family protein [Methylophilaceae bacterium]
MKQSIAFSKTRVSLMLITLITTLSACNQQNADEVTAAETPAQATEVTANSAGVAYITSQNAGVSVVDLSTMEIIKNIDVKAESPRGLGITDDGKKLIVATRENESIAVIDTETGEVIQQINVGKNPEFVRIRGNFAFVSSEPSAVGGPPPKPGSKEEDDDDDDDDDKTPARIAIVDLNKGEKIKEIVGGPETEGIEFSGDGTQIVITNEADNTITVHNIETGELVKTIHTHEYGDRPRGIKISPDGKTYVATLEYGNKLMVLDQDFNLIRTVDTGNVPYGVSFDATGDHIYVAANKDKVLQVFDAKTYEKIKDIPTGNRCWHFSFTPDDKQILLACGKSDATFVIDTETQAVTKEIPTPGMPWGIVTYPKSMGSLDTKL